MTEEANLQFFREQAHRLVGEGKRPYRVAKGMFQAVLDLHFYLGNEPGFLLRLQAAIQAELDHAEGRIMRQMHEIEKQP